jgi:hypothetical protein
MRRLSTLLGVVLSALAVGVGQAAAEESGGTAQAAGQSAMSGQGAGAGGGAYQSGPTNTNLNIRVLSPGNNGSVTQSNDTTAGAVAANSNTTNQTVGQSQTGGGYGSDYAQIAGQSAANRQSADADAVAVQLAPSNESSAIRVLSPGNNGDVDQSNDATAGAVAGNDNDTTQKTDQSQTGGSGSDYTQIAGQDAANRQSADADAAAVQVKPSNDASSIRVLSPGNDGDVSQSNSTTALAVAANDNDTTQSIGQSQAGLHSKGDSDYTQIAGQSATSAQSAEAGALAVQVKPSNDARSIRVLSPGNDGDVTQSNSAKAIGLALNDNKTTQSIRQSQTGGGYGSDSLQVAGQGSWSAQKAGALAVAIQLGASNDYAPVRVGSPGGGGSVEQSNSVGALAAALNGNATKQSLSQAQTGYGSDYLQVAGQGSWSDQRSGAMSLAWQGMLKRKPMRR